MVISSEIRNAPAAVSARANRLLERSPLELLDPGLECAGDREGIALRIAGIPPRVADLLQCGLQLGKIVAVDEPLGRDAGSLEFFELSLLAEHAATFARRPNFIEATQGWPPERGIVTAG